MMKQLRILFITDPLAHFKIAKDSTYAMMDEAAHRGHVLYVCELHEIALFNDEVQANCHLLTLVHTHSDSILKVENEDTGRTSYSVPYVTEADLTSQPNDENVLNEAENIVSVQTHVRKANVKHNDRNHKGVPMEKNWYQLSNTQIIKLHEFDVVLMRKDPPFDMEYVTATWLLSHAYRRGARIFNHPNALRDHSEKLSIAEFPQFTVPTLVTRDITGMRAFHQKYQDIIIKPLDGMGGTGVFRITQDGLNLNAIIETLGQQGTRSLIAQQFIPEISVGDKRILLIAGQVIPFALARIPAQGEIRGNLAAGGQGIAQPLTIRDLEIAQTLAPILWQRGLLIVGIDVIGHYLTEINITSPTCFREISAQTHINVAAITLTALENICQSSSNNKHILK